MRKKLGLILVLSVFILTQVLMIGNVFAATDVSINDYDVSDRHNNDISSIYKDTEFTLDLYFTVDTGVSLTYLTISQDSSFYPSDGEYQQDVIGNNHAPLVLKYKGTGNNLKFNLKYEKNGQKLDTDLSVNISEAVPEDVSKPEPVDTTKFKPVLSIVGDTDAPKGEAGKKMSITLPIKNTGLYAAKNVKVSLDTSDLSKFPFKLEKMNFQKSLDQIAANEIKPVTFDLTVADNADSGDYILKFNFSYTNPYNDEMSGSDTIFIKIENNSTAPQVIVSKIITSPETVTPGSTVRVSFILKNIGTLPAKDVKTTLRGMDSNTFTIENSTDVLHIGDIKGGGTESASYTLDAAKNISGGRYGLTLKLDYSSPDKKTYSEESQFFIHVDKPEEGKALLTMDSIQSPTDVIPVNQDFKVGLNVSNLGTAAAKNIKISVSTDKEIISKSLNTIIVNSLDGNDSKSYEFTLCATQDAVSKYYPISLNLEYDTIEDGKTVKNSLSQYVGVYIEAAKKEEVKKTVPRLIVSGYNFGDSSRKAGENFDLVMSFLNTSRNIPIGNLKITFTSDDGTFTIVGSNTFFVEYLDTKQKIEKSIKLSAKPDASPKAYPLSINFEYEDEKGNQYTSKETISIPIIQDLRFVTGDINLAPENYPSQPAPVNLEFYNMGKTTLYNLLVTVEGDFDGQKPRYFVGNFEPGRSDTFDGTITPKAPGQVKGSVVFTYEDAAGKQTVVKKEFSLNVIQMAAMPGKMPPEMMQPGMDGQKDKGSKKLIGPFSLLHLVLMGVGLIVVIVVIVILRKRHVRKKEMMFDELS